MASRKSFVLNEIREMDRREEDGRLSADVRVTKEDNKLELQKLIVVEEMSWRQKSWVPWLKERDRTTTFFHCLANARRQNNFVSCLKFGDTCTNVWWLHNHVGWIFACSVMELL